MNANYPRYLASALRAIPDQAVVVDLTVCHEDGTSPARVGRIWQVLIEYAGNVWSVTGSLVVAPGTTAWPTPRPTSTWMSRDGEPSRPAHQHGIHAAIVEAITEHARRHIEGYVEWILDGEASDAGRCD